MQENVVVNSRRTRWEYRRFAHWRTSWWQVVLVLLALCVVPAHAQYRASLQGTVADSQGAMIPGAQLILTDTATNRVIAATSDGEGNFVINQLMPSTYKLEVTRDGFKKKVLDGVHIIAEQANALNVVLETGGTTETVTVNAGDAPVIDTATGSISGTITQENLAKMPDFGRDPLQLANLAPGMFGDAAQNGGGGSAGIPGNQGPGSVGASSGPYQTENRPQVTGNGGRPDTNGVTIDGVQSTSVTWGSAAVVTPNPDTIKEMKVVTNPYDAELGRFSGAQIQLITQNGTNQFHGTGLFKLDRPGLNAYQRWSPDNNPQRDNARFNEFGGTVGGPIVHNRLFFFFGYDTIRNHGTNTGGGWYETSSFDNSSTSGTNANKFLSVKGIGVSAKNILEGAGDPHKCADVGLIQGVNCNWIEGQGLDLGKPLTIGVGQSDPSYTDPTTVGGVKTFHPGLGGDGTGSYAANMDGNADMFYVATTGPNNTINTQYNGRVDYQMTSKDLVAGNIYYVPVKSDSFSDRSMNFFHHNAKNYSMGVLYNHTFSGTMLNEARADMAGWKWNELKDNPQIPAGLPSANIQHEDGSNSFASINPNGIAPSIGSVFDQWTLNFKDVLTKVYKSHNLKFGGQYTKLAQLDSATWAASENFYFNNYWDFLNDAPQTEAISGADPLTGIPTMSRKDDRQKIPSVFVQDDWKVKPNLTVNLGLRWEYFGGMTEKKGNNPRLNLGGMGPGIFQNLNIALNQAQVDAQKANFGPQIGFAWMPMRDQGKLVLRGGFGMAYNGLEQAITTNTRFDPPFLTNSNTLTGNKIVYGINDVYTYGSLPGNPALISTFNSANLPTSGVAINITGIDPKLKTSYVYRYSLEAQYDLGSQWVATLGYTGSSGRHLPLQYNLYNKYAAQILSSGYEFNPIVNFIDWYEDSGTSSYNALRAELRHQFAHTFEADVQYQWAHSLDNGSGPYTQSDYQWLPGQNWGNSDFDARNTIKMFGMWSPVIFHGNSMAEKLVGGWTFSPIFVYHSGFPYNPHYGGLGCNAFYRNNGNCDLRPGSYKGGASSSQATDSFKTAAGHYPGGGTAYFDEPSEVDNLGPGGTTEDPVGWSDVNSVPTPSALPGLPGIGRNAFYGPRYSDLDFAATKSFGLPAMKVLGENARLEIRANAFNVFNKLNLSSVEPDITNPNFGRANSALGSRTIEGEFHFKF
jgi:hypothetical protein